MTTADCLVLDRIAREAWLPRARSQVNSVAARQLLLLREGGAFQPVADGYELRLDKALPRLRDELGIVKAMESASVRGQDLPKTTSRSRAGFSATTATTLNSAMTCQ
jgi:hypothetical protein